MRSGGCPTSKACCWIESEGRTRRDDQCRLRNDESRVGRWVDEEQVPSFKEKRDNVLQGVENEIQLQKLFEGIVVQDADKKLKETNP